MVSTVAQAYMGVWRLCKDKAPGQRVRGLYPPEADDILVLWEYICAQILSLLLNFE